MQLLLRYVPRYVGRVLSSESQEKSGKVAFVKKLHSFPALAGMELKRSQTQDIANWTCVVSYRVRRKSVFNQRCATPVEICQVILLLTAPC